MPAGRPRKIEDQATKNQILGMIQVGASRGDVARSLGITVSTIANEAKRDDEFFDNLMKAEMAAKMKALKKIYDAPQWQAAAWLLSRKYPNEWGPKAIEAGEASIPSIEFVESDKAMTDMQRRLDELERENAEMKNALEHGAERAIEYDD